MGDSIVQSKEVVGCKSVGIKISELAKMRVSGAVVNEAGTARQAGQPSQQSGSAGCRECGTAEKTVSATVGAAEPIARAAASAPETGSGTATTRTPVLAASDASSKDLFRTSARNALRTAGLSVPESRIDYMIGSAFAMDLATIDKAKIPTPGQACSTSTATSSPDVRSSATQKIDPCNERFLTWWMCWLPISRTPEPDRIRWYLLGKNIQIYLCCNEYQGSERVTCWPTVCNDLHGGSSAICPPSRKKISCPSNDAFCPEKKAAYQTVLANPKIKTVLSLTASQIDTLWLAITELEINATTHWEQLNNYNISYLTAEQLELVWLRTVATVLFNEMSCEYTWSILNYSTQSLRALLLFAPTDLQPNATLNLSNDLFCGMDYWVVDAAKNRYGFAGVWNANPLVANSIRKSIQQTSVVHDHVDAAIAILNRFWNEPNYKCAEDNECHFMPDGGQAKNLDYLWTRGMGGCRTMARICRWIFRAFNIPLINGAAFSTDYHHGIKIPTVNAIFPWVDAIILPVGGKASNPAHFMPIQEALLSYSTWHYLCAKGDLKMCETFQEWEKYLYTRWFAYKNDNVVGAKLKSVFFDPLVIDVQKTFLDSHWAWLYWWRPPKDNCSYNVPPALSDGAFKKQFEDMIEYFGVEKGSVLWEKLVIYWVQ